VMENQTIQRLYVEKKEGYRHAASALREDIRSFLGIEALKDVRILIRYDVEGVTPDVMRQCRNTVFSEPQVDDVLAEPPLAGASRTLVLEYLPGQFDQRSDSAAQCVQLVSMGERPLVRATTLYLFYGPLDDAAFEAIKNHIINPVECREGSLEMPQTLRISAEEPARVPVIEGFLRMDESALYDLIARFGFAMDQNDIRCCQRYFQSEGRDPTLTELRMLDTYWSDHCRHTTFLTELQNITIEDAKARAAYERYLAIRAQLGRTETPVTLMDLAVIGKRKLKADGLMTDEDESDEINACTVKIDVDVEGHAEPWLLLFKNETHNHPTEIEPFGGAATCIGGAIRDPLSGRGYVYQAMRLTGAADPTRPLDQTIPGKLPQRKLTVTAANGYSSYGNQVGLATGLVDEMYHDGYAAKRLEIGAVVGAAPARNVRREEPQPGDLVVLLGGRTGRDGIGGATGSSKSHDISSLETCGAEVQKGNAPEERKLQRLFRNPEATRLIKRCNDFGAGGVSVAIGELADGLTIDLDRVPKKYEGLDGTELAISESQERMAVVLARADAAAFEALADAENLEATVVAEVTQQKRLVMRWRGEVIADIARAFLNSNGARRFAHVHVKPPEAGEGARFCGKSFFERLRAMAGDLNICSRQGLAERFDSTIGAGTVLMPFGGARQKTPAQAMVAKLPVLYRETSTCTAMAWGCNPYILERDPYRGAYLAVVESVAKLVACGAGARGAHLTFQEYFERLGSDPARWGKPFAALLGALAAQLDLGIAAIGGKDSMSGSFETLDVPPTLASFAVNTASIDQILSPEFKRAGDKVWHIAPQYDGEGMPRPDSLKAAFDCVEGCTRSGRAAAVWACGFGGVAEGVLKMCLGNGIGFAYDEGYPLADAFDCAYGSFLVELDGEDPPRAPEGALVRLVGRTDAAYRLSAEGACEEIAHLERIYDGRLAGVFPSDAPGPAPASPGSHNVPAYEHRGRNRARPRVRIAKPRVLIPVFPGTNCEYDTANAWLRAGALPDIAVINNRSPEGVLRSARDMAARIERAQIVFLPGGFSGGDEPDGSGKFINAFFRSPMLRDAIERLLTERDGLMGGICNGFQALIKLGLVPFGRIVETDDTCPTLTFNTIGRHQSRLVRTRVASTLSPWLMRCEVGDVFLTPISHGEGRFVCGEAMLRRLAAQGQIALQYASAEGQPGMSIDINPNGSIGAVEGITSPDGRVFGKMAHSERWGEGLYLNVPGRDGSAIFAGAVDYFAD
jgi:phosphoribosylformylglycinamidine synthase